MTSSSRRPGGVLAVVAVAGLLGGGCGAQSGGPVTVPVRGLVLLDGKPLSSGVVQFQPASGQVATGEIAADGSFTLSRTTPGDGVLPGTYSVAVVSYDPAAEVQSVENLRVPLKYTRFGSSGIEFTVFPGTKEPLRIELVSDAKAADGADAAPSSDQPAAAPGKAGGESEAEPAANRGD